MKHNKRRDLLGDDSPLDRPIEITWFPDRNAFRKESWTCTLRQFAQEVLQTVEESKEALPWFSGNTYGSKRSEGHSLRNNANVKDVTSIVVDYDGEVTSMKDAAQIVEAANLLGVFYPSASYTAERPRWRLMCPLSEPHNPDDRTPLVERLNGLFGGTIDQQASFTLSQGFYYGTIAGKEMPDPILTEGRTLDRANDLKGLPKQRRKDDGEHETDDSRSGAAFRKAMELHLNGRTIEDFEEWATDNPWGDSERDFDRAVKRVWERAAIEAGKKALANSKLDFEDLGQDSEAKSAKSDKRKSTLTNLDFAKVGEPNSTLEIVEDLLSTDSFTCVYGPSKSGKTFFLLDLSLHIALNMPWQGRGVLQSGVCYISLEGAGGFCNRIAAWQLNHGIDDLSDYPFHAMTGSFDMRNDKATAEHIVAAAKELESRTGIPTRLIMIDTLARAMAGGEENSAQDMGAIIRVADKLRLATGATVCLVHHTGKDTTKGARGSSALMAAVDTEIELSRNGESRCAEVTKQKDGIEGDTFRFKLQQVELGYNKQWGKPAQSCVVAADVVTDFEDLTDLGDRTGKAIGILKKLIQRANRLDDFKGDDSQAAIHQDAWRAALQKAEWPKAGQTNGAFRTAWARLKRDADILMHVEFDGENVRCK